MSEIPDLAKLLLQPLSCGACSRVAPALSPVAFSPLDLFPNQRSPC